MQVGPKRIAAASIIVGKAAKVDSEFFRDLAPQFDTYAFPETVRVFDIKWRLTATPTMSFRLGTAAFGSGVGRFSSEGPAPFSARVAVHRNKKPIAGRSALFMETNSKDLFCGKRSVSLEDHLAIVSVLCQSMMLTSHIQDCSGTKALSIHELSQFSN